MRNAALSLSNSNLRPRGKMAHMATFILPAKQILQRLRNQIIPYVSITRIINDVKVSLAGDPFRFKLYTFFFLMR